MSTINFQVGVPAGAITGTVDGQDSYISSYLALHVSGYSLSNNVIFCVQPDATADTSSVSSYTVQPGISGLGFSLNEVNALKGLFSNYIDSGNTSFANQEVTMLADWGIVNPSLTVGADVSSSVVSQANNLITQALAGDLKIDSSLNFLTFVSTSGNQSFVNISEVPLPAGLLLFVSALVLLGSLALRKKRGATEAHAPEMRAS
ncbi:MAG: hypothetical protein KGJ13_09130 [Patescibacteria group bacterium]|nr:hypothetical protein [Patescibacteria group bacterium]